MRAGREEAILAGPPEAIHESGLAHGRKRVDGDLWLTIGHKGRSQMLIFEAAPIARRDDDDAILVDPDEAIECRSAGAAIETARQMSLLPHLIGSFDYCRSGDPATGRCEPVEILRRFGGL
jgi:hypothetical protein